MQFRVLYLDETEAEVVATASAIRAFEREHDESLLHAMSTARSYWADFIAHHSLTQTTDEVRPLDEWLDTVQTLTYGMPADRVAQIAEAIGVHLSAEEVDAVRPTGGASKDRSRANSSKPRSTRAKASTN